MTMTSHFDRYRIWMIIALCVMFLLLLVQFVLPLVVRHYANAAINSYPGLGGEIGRVQLDFIPGKYVVQDIKLHYTEKDQKEILHLDELGVRVHWTSLLKGAIDVDAWLQSPHLIIWASKSEATNNTSQQKKEKIKKVDWQNQIRDLVPFKINTFEVRNGTVLYRDVHTNPRIDLKIEDISVKATNLTNREDLKDSMFAKVSVRAKLFSSGHAELDMALDPLTKQPTFNVQSAIKGVDLTKLNNLLLAYGKFDVERGTFSMYSEIASKNGKFIAYVKPVFRNIDVRAWESREHRNNKLLVLWKNIVGLVVDFLKNKEKDQIATKIKAEGTFDDPDLSVWEAVVTLLRNGFIQALIPGYDNSINWTDVPDSKAVGDD